MFFDDRLATVLRQEGSSPSAKRTQFRQLLDILGNRGSATGERRGGRSDPSLVAAAWLRMDSLGRSIPPAERAMIIREPSWRFRSAELAAHLADFEPEVAVAALNRAQLSSEDWSALIPRLPVRARGFLRFRRDLPRDVENLLDQLGVSDRGLPLPSSPPPESEQGGSDNTNDAQRRPETQPETQPQQPADEAGLPEDARALPPFMLLDLDREAEIAAQGDGGNVGDSVGLSDGKEDGGASPPEVELIEERPSRTPAMPDAENANAADTRDPLGDGPPETARSEISALVARIAQFQRIRDGEEPEAPEDSERSPPLPLGLPMGERDASRRKISQGFAFCADSSGRIEWADSEVAPMVIGARLAPSRADGAVIGDDACQIIRHAIDLRQPITGAKTHLQGAPMIAGQWCLDAQPRFTFEGHFTGYVGRFRRPAEQLDEAAERAAKEGDRIRELLHELRTPVTAVQGYAEVIQQQLFGPAPHEYRALAASIAADAAHVLAGFEELDRLARLETGIIAIEEGTSDLAQIIAQITTQLGKVLAPRQAGIDIAIDGQAALVIAGAHEETEAMIWRLLASLAGGCEAGEVIRGKLASQNGLARLTCDLPRQITGKPDVAADLPESGEFDMFRAQMRPVGRAVTAGVFGAGFVLRLARAEARALGGDLVQAGARVEVNLPLLHAASGHPGGETAAGSA